MTESKAWGCPTCGDTGIAVNPFRSKCSVCDSWRMHLATGNPTREQHPADECPERREIPCPTCAAHWAGVAEAVAGEKERAIKILKEHKRGSDVTPDGYEYWMVQPEVVEAIRGGVS